MSYSFEDELTGNSRFSVYVNVYREMRKRTSIAVERIDRSRMIRTNKKTQDRNTIQPLNLGTLFDVLQQPHDRQLHIMRNQKMPDYNLIPKELEMAEKRSAPVETKEADKTGQQTHHHTKEAHENAKKIEKEGFAANKNGW